ncbi:MAG: UDP-2,3-diacylglucosamine diphosphatase LpxI [Acidobacteria bacterium]|nr:UDP-2,3-diacylglucosamine diphosphatase LpxI [Acidobacteriota bacterium]
MDKLGLIAGNGKFPLLVLEAARRQNISVVVAAIREETFPEIEEVATRVQQGSQPAAVHWLRLGQLGKLIEIFSDAGVKTAMMAGQVRHVQLFGSSRPDWRMMRLLLSLRQKNTDSLIGGIVRVLEQEGIQLIDSTLLLQDLLADKGVLTRRKLTTEEKRDIEYGLRIAREIARLDLGQTVVVKDQAVVAVEAMEGTDETLRRAARLVNGQRLTLIKVSKPEQDMRFDVPVVGLQTLHVLHECNVTALAVDAGKTLLLDRQQFLETADRMKIAVFAV